MQIGHEKGLLQNETTQNFTPNSKVTQYSWSLKQEAHHYKIVKNDKHEKHLTTSI